VNTDYRGHWLATTYRDLGAKVLVADSRLIPQVADLDGLPFQHIVVNGEQPESVLAGAAMHDLRSFSVAAPLSATPDLRYGDPAAIIWSSGTTGRSKGVVESHNSWLRWAEYHNVVYRDGIREGERLYTCSPLYNVTGWIMSVFPALVAGAPACIDPKFSVSRFWDRVRHYSAAHIGAVGTMHLYLWNQPERDDDRENPVRTMSMAPLLPELIDGFKQRFGIERITSAIGQSEVKGYSIWRDDMDLSPRSAGLVNTPDSLIDVVVVNDHDQPLPPGETGEICVRPREPYVMYSGYAGAAEATVAAWRNLWHHTGDLGRITERDELFFVDRKKDSTRHKGRNISSFEVEQIAIRYPGVALAVVVGLRVAELEAEDELLLTVISAEGMPIDPLKLAQFIDANAPYFFVPRFVHVTDSVPMTPSLKVRKFEIRDAGVPEGAWDMHQQQWRPTR
jgi:crotonobetaine/carnitine-CoA ligase